MAGSLSVTEINAATPREKKYWLNDRLNGLYLLVMPTGAKYWKFRFRYNGKNDELTVGRPYPAMKLATARVEARRLQVLVDAGRNPRLERKQEKFDARSKSVHTFEDGANAWYAFRLPAWKFRTADQIRQYLNKDLLPRLGRRLLDEITTEDLATVVKAIDERGATDVAKKTRQWFTGLFKIIVGSDPSFQAKGPRAEDIEKIGRGIASVLDALNPLRNRASLAHPNDSLLDEPEAMLVINSIRTLLHYLNSKLR